MYIDGVIIFSLVVIALILVMMWYIYRYAQKHIAIDIKKADKEKKTENLHSQAFKKISADSF